MGVLTYVMVPLAEARKVSARALRARADRKCRRSQKSPGKVRSVSASQVFALWQAQDAQTRSGSRLHKIVSAARYWL